MSGSVSIPSGSEEYLQAALAYIGPVSVAVDASNSAFRVCHYYILQNTFYGMKADTCIAACYIYMCVLSCSTTQGGYTVPHSALVLI